MSAPEAARKESSGRSVRPRPVPSQAITPAAEPQVPPLLLPGEWAAFPRGPTGGGACGAQTPPLAWRGRVPTRRRQGDNDITSAAGFGTFRAAVAVAGKHPAGAQPGAGSARQTPDASTRRPGRPLLGASLPDSRRMPVPVLTPAAAPSRTVLPAGRLLPSHYSCHCPCSELIQQSPSSPPSPCPRPPSIPPFLDHCHSLPSGLPFALSLQSVIHLAPKALIKSLPWGFPGGAVVKNLPSNAGEPGSSPGVGKSPHAAEQLSP